MIIGLLSIKNKRIICEGLRCTYIHFLQHLGESKHIFPLELVQAHILGPTKNPSLGKKRYLLLFIYDYSRMMWEYILEKNLEAFSHFMQFNVLTENQSDIFLRSSERIEGENLRALNSIAFVWNIELKKNSQQDTHFNKMVLRKEKCRSY